MNPNMFTAHNPYPNIEFVFTPYASYRCTECNNIWEYDAADHSSADPTCAKCAKQKKKEKN